ncbi:MAG: hypothetical protein NTY01_05035 [Verrucomicrobia bacterium]|nr:hypothetical protein [Verrucomicrobiota bacterium]
MKWMIAAAMLAGAMVAHAAPWLGLVATNTTSQASANIPLGTLAFSLDLRVNTDGNPVGALQYHIITSPANEVTYGATPLTAKDNPFAATDLGAPFGHAPVAGATVNSAGDGVTTWFKSANPDYTAFPEQTIGTYEFNVSSLGIGTYVFTPVGELLSYGGGEEINTFATPGAFVLAVVPEPGAGTLLVYGGLVAAWRNRRRDAR